MFARPPEQGQWFNMTVFVFALSAVYLLTITQKSCREVYDVCS